LVCEFNPSTLQPGRSSGVDRVALSMIGCHVAALAIPMPPPSTFTEVISAVRDRPHSPAPCGTLPEFDDFSAAAGVDFEFSFAFQSIIDADRREAVSFEALLRRPHASPQPRRLSGCPISGLACKKGCHNRGCCPRKHKALAYGSPLDHVHSAWENLVSTRPFAHGNAQPIPYLCRRYS